MKAEEKIEDMLCQLGRIDNDYEYDDGWEMIKQYANQRVIDELEEILEQDKLPTVYINERIKELKQ